MATFVIIGSIISGVIRFLWIFLLSILLNPQTMFPLIKYKIHLKM